MSENNRMIIHSNHELRWFKPSPLLICGADLYKDSDSDELYANIKLMNIQPESLKEIEIDIICYGIIRNETARLEGYTFRDMNLERNRCFGEDEFIPIDCSDAISIDVILKSAVTLDGEKWINESLTPFNTVIKQERISQRMGRYFSAFSDSWKKEGLPEEKLLYAPSINEDYWLCACGAFNWGVEKSCCECGAGLEWLFERLESVKKSGEKTESFSAGKSEFAAAPVSENTLVQPNKPKNKHETKPERNKPKKKRGLSKGQKRFTAFTLAILLLGVMAVCVYFLVIPLSSYYQAVSLINSGEYDKAIDELSNLNGFGESDKEILRAKYLKAESLMSKQDYLGAANIFGEIDYNDSSDKYMTAMYSYGVQLYSGGEYIDALKVFTDLGGYSDSSKQASKAETAAMDEGKKLYENKNYSEASELFTRIYEITQGLNALEQANTALLSQADYLYDTNKYVEALKLYESLSGFDHVDVTIKKLDSLKKLLSTSIYTGEESSVWENTTMQCSSCHAPTLTYQFILSDNGSFQLYRYCSVHDENQEDYEIIKGQYKIEDDVIYTLKHNGGATEWTELCKIENISSDSSVQGKNAKLVMTNPFDKSSSSLTLYGNILEEDPSLI